MLHQQRPDSLHELLLILDSLHVDADLFHPIELFNLIDRSIPNLNLDNNLTNDNDLQLTPCFDGFHCGGAENQQLEVNLASMLLFSVICATNSDLPNRLSISSNFANSSSSAFSLS